MKIMSAELLTPARLVIEYPIMHYYGIPRDIQSMTGRDMYDCDRVFLGTPVHIALWEFSLIMHSSINMDSQKKVKSLRFC